MYVTFVVVVLVAYLLVVTMSVCRLLYPHHAHVPGPLVWQDIIYAVLMGSGKLICGLWLVERIFSASGSSGTSAGELSDLFLVVTWAIVVCTIPGPLRVGWCARPR